MTACSFAVSAHGCWNWAVRAVRTAIPLFILGPTLSTCRSWDMRRLESIRRPCRSFCVTTRRADFEAFVAADLRNDRARLVSAKERILECLVSLMCYVQNPSELRFAV